MSRIIPIISILLLVLIILGGVFYWWPKYKEFRDLGIELKIKEEQVRQKEEYFAELRTIDERLEGYSEELAKIDSALPADPSIPALFNFIQQTSSENGLILEAINAPKISSLGGGSGEKIQEISFSISFSGSYSAFKNFLSAIYGTARLIEVKSVKFSSPEEGGTIFNFILELKTHFLPE